MLTFERGVGTEEIGMEELEEIKVVDNAIFNKHPSFPLKRQQVLILRMIGSGEAVTETTVVP